MFSVCFIKIISKHFAKVVKVTTTTNTFTKLKPDSAKMFKESQATIKKGKESAIIGVKDLSERPKA